MLWIQILFIIVMVNQIVPDCNVTSLPKIESWQSSEYDGNVIQQFINLLKLNNKKLEGSFISLVSTGECAQTTNEMNPWFQVKLDENYYITSVTMTSPPASENSALQNILIEVASVSVQYTDPTWLTAWDNGKSFCAYYEDQLPDDTTFTINCTTVAFGNIVRVTKLTGITADKLSICEVIPNGILGQCSSLYFIASPIDQPSSSTIGFSSTMLVLPTTLETTHTLTLTSQAHQTFDGTSFGKNSHISSAASTPVLSTIAKPILPPGSTSLSSALLPMMTSSLPLSWGDFFSSTPALVSWISSRFPATSHFETSNTEPTIFTSSTLGQSKQSYMTSAAPTSTSFAHLVPTPSYSFETLLTLTTLPSPSETSIEVHKTPSFTTILNTEGSSIYSVLLTTPSILQSTDTNSAETTSKGDASFPTPMFSSHFATPSILLEPSDVSHSSLEKSIAPTTTLSGFGEAPMQSSISRSPSLFSYALSSYYDYSTESPLCSILTSVSSKVDIDVSPLSSYSLDNSLPSSLANIAIAPSSALSLSSPNMWSPLLTTESIIVSTDFQFSTLPSLSSFNAPSSTLPSLSSFNAPSSTLPSSSSFNAPSRTLPSLSSFNAPPSTVPSLSSFNAPSSSLPSLSSFNAPSSTLPSLSSFNGPLTTLSSLSSFYVPSSTVPVWCPCLCEQFYLIKNLTSTNKTNDEVADEIEELIANMTVDTKTTTINKVKLNSAGDERTSAKIVGTIGMAFFVGTFVLIVLSDVPVLYKLIKRLVRSVRNARRKRQRSLERPGSRRKFSSLEVIDIEHEEGETDT